MLNMSELTSKSRGAVLHFVGRYCVHLAFDFPAFTAVISPRTARAHVRKIMLVT